MTRWIWSAIGPVVDWVRDLLERLVAVRLIESALVLAAQAFLALVPLIIAAYAILPEHASNGLLDAIRRRFGLTGESASAVNQLIGHREELQQSLSWLSFLIILGSATAFTRALQRVYERAWELEKLGLRGIWRSVAWVLGMVVYLSIVGFFVHLVKDAGASTTFTTLLGLGLWWWTPFLLLGGRVRWRALLPGAALTAIAQFIVALVSIIVLPRTIRNNETHYGPIGVVFAIESWLVVLGGVLVVSSAIGATLGLSRGRIGTLIRGTEDPEGWRRQMTPRQLRWKRKVTGGEK